MDVQIYVAVYAFYIFNIYFHIYIISTDSVYIYLNSYLYFCPMLFLLSFSRP